jgi:formylglycine-generating enzyme required for sulfatase activity
VYGGVNYSYNIGQYDVTLSQYTAFLNAVAQLDPYNLYNSSLANNFSVGNITRSGSNGSYSYAVVGDGQRPVTFVTWFDAARFANWMQNGQPSGLGEVNASTEDGAYSLHGALAGVTVTKNANALYWIPTESEWYKAAYYDPTLNGGAGGYWTDATKGNGVLGSTVGNQPHQANYNFSTGGVGGFLTEVGAFTASFSFYNIYDGSGDVYQWNDAVIGDTYRGDRGGAWDSSSQSLLLSTDRSFSDPASSTNDLGFRLATIPEPSPWAAFAGGAAILLAWGRRRS